VSGFRDRPTWGYTLMGKNEWWPDLYVGITCDLRGRMRQHAADKPWWPQVYLVDAWLYSTRTEAEAWEALAINGWRRPLYNIHVPRPIPLPDDWHFALNSLDCVQLWADEAVA
jgi:hypothetical protein